MVAVELTCATINTDMTRLENDLARACEALGIRMDLGFKLSCPDGHEVRSIARLHAVGAPNGMLVVGTFEEVEDYCNYWIQQDLDTLCSMSQETMKFLTSKATDRCFANGAGLKGTAPDRQSGS